MKLPLTRSLLLQGSVPLFPPGSPGSESVSLKIKSNNACDMSRRLWLFLVKSARSILTGGRKVHSVTRFDSSFSSLHHSTLPPFLSLFIVLIIPLLLQFISLLIL